jgi:hypothetical protein
MVGKMFVLMVGARTHPLVRLDRTAAHCSSSFFFNSFGSKIYEAGGGRTFSAAYIMMTWQVIVSVTSNGTQQATGNNASLP